MTNLNVHINGWQGWLKQKSNNFDFPKTRFLITKNKINVRILALLNEKGEIVNQLQDCGIVVLDKTILSAYDELSISEQGVISSDFFQARIIDVNNSINQEIYFHLVKVISGIITVNYDHQVTLTGDEEFNQRLFNNKLGRKLFVLFLENNCHDLANNKDIKLIANEQNFQLECLKKMNLKDKIFEVRDCVNKFLVQKPIKYTNYQFLNNEFTKEEMANVSRLEKIEINQFKNHKNKLNVSFLVGKENIDNFLLNSKKELMTGIKIFNHKIKLINNPKLIKEFYCDVNIDSYEKLILLKQNYLKLKKKFERFQKQNFDLIKKIINDSAGIHYSEKIGEYEFIHVNFNNALIDKSLLEIKALEKIEGSENKVIFLSNNDFDNSMMIWSISNNLNSKIKFETLINQFTSLDFKKISYNNQCSVFIEADNYQVINDFIRNIINFFKISNNQTISI